MKKMILALALTIPLAACQTAQQQCATAKKPNECLQVVQAGGNVNDYLLYGMAGYMLSSAINGNGQRQPVIIADPNYRGYRRPIPSYSASRDYVTRKTTVTASSSTGSFGGSKTTTTTTRSYSSPSYRSYSSPSFGSSYRSSSSFGRR